MKIEINSPAFAVKVTAPNGEVTMDVSVKDYHVSLDLIGLLACVTQIAVAVNRADDVVTGKTPMSEVLKPGRPDDLADAIAYAVGAMQKEGATTGRMPSEKAAGKTQQTEQSAAKGFNVEEMLQNMFPGMEVKRLDLDELLNNPPKKAE